MIEINITRFVIDENFTDYSDSIANSGLQNIGKITYQNALNQAYDPDDRYLNTPEKLAAFCDYVREFGAWSDDEIDQWSDQEVEALFLQFISGELQEIEPYLEHTYLTALTQSDIDLLEHQWNQGQLSCNVYPVLPKDENEPTQWYFTISH